MVNRLSLFLFVLISLSFHSAFSGEYEINYYGQKVLVSSNQSFDQFVIKDPDTMSVIDVTADEKADLFHASRAINRIVDYDPSKAKNQLNNELNKAVAKYKQNGIVSEWVNTQLENTASLLTSGAISFVKVKATAYLCTRSGGTACAVGGTALVASAVSDMGDSLGGSVISNKHLFDEQRSFNLVKEAVKTTYDEIDEFSPVRQALIVNTGPVDYRDIVYSDYQIGSIQTNAQELVPVLQSVSSFGSSLTPLQRVGRGIATSVVNGVTGFPASSTVAALDVMLSDASSLHLDKVTSAVNHMQSEFSELHVQNTSNIVAVQKLTDSVSSNLVIQAAQLVMKQQKEQQEQAEAAAAIVEGQNVNDEKLYQQQLESTRSTMWRDLSDMRSVLDQLSDDIVNATTEEELAAAVDAARVERNNARSLKRIHERNYEGYSQVISQLESGVIEACYSYVGCYRQGDLSELRTRKAESFTLLNEYVAYFERNGGLNQVYDSAREQLAAAQKEKIHQANAAQYRQEAIDADIAAQVAAQQAAIDQQKIDEIIVSEIPETAKLPETLVLTPDGNENEEFLAKLVTGSPVSISQSVDVPLESFYLNFDYLFETGAGSLDVFLDDILLGSLTGDDSQLDFLTASMLVDGSLLGLNNIDLTFLFTDNEAGSILWLDNIIYPDLMDGIFSQGLTYWIPEGEGYAEVVNFNAALNGGGGNTESLSVPEPYTVLLLSMGLLLIVIFKSLNSRNSFNRVSAS